LLGPVNSTPADRFVICRDNSRQRLLPSLIVGLGHRCPEMDDPAPRTEFVRRMILGRPYEPDLAYSRDLMALERFLSTRSVGMADSLILSNLLSRYPREADAIVKELGVRPFIPLGDERVSALVDERIRLALSRHPLRRLRSDAPIDLLEL